MEIDAIGKMALKRFVLFLAISLLIFNIAYMTCSTFIVRNARQGRVEINRKNSFEDIQTADAGHGICLGDIYKLRDALQGDTVSYSCESQCIAENGDKTLEAGLVMTDDCFISFDSLDIFKGTFLNNDACINGRNVAVISEKTARDLYSSYDVIGMDIDISGMKYKIIGIYRPHSSIISLLGDDGRERIYIPLESTDQCESRLINTIYIQGETIGQESFRVHFIEEMLGKELGADAGAYRINDYYNASAALTQPSALLVFCAGFYIMWALSGYMIIFLKRVISILKNSSSEFYLKDAVKSARTQVIKSILTAALPACLAVVTFFIIRFTPYLPNDKIPPENIFDMRFYMGKAVDAIKEANSSYGYIPTYFETNYKNAFILLFIMLIASTILFLLSIYQLKLLRLTGGQESTVVNASLISVAVALALTLILAPAAGLGLSIPIKELAVLWSFVVLFGAGRRRIESQSGIARSGSHM